MKYNTCDTVNEVSETYHSGETPQRGDYVVVITRDSSYFGRYFKVLSFEGFTAHFQDRKTCLFLDKLQKVSEREYLKKTKILLRVVRD